MGSQPIESNDSATAGSDTDVQTKFNDLVRSMTASEKIKMLKLLGKLKKLKKYDGQKLSESEVKAILDDVIPGMSDTIDATASIIDLID